MSFLAFQREAGRDLPRLIAAASSRLDAPIAVEEGDVVVLRVGDALFSASSSPTTSADHARADAAAVAGRAAGMDRLARLCPVVWRVTRLSGGDADELRLRASLAFVLLGPILPDEEETLYGVRGARERLSALVAAAASSR